jgi:hypothetical protein
VKVWGLSKEKASYKPAPGSEVRCDACKYMFPRFAVGGCRLVRGVIKNSATCNEFEARARS